MFFLILEKFILPKENIKENSTKQTKCFYSKNKLTTENFLRNKLKSKFIIFTSWQCYRKKN